MSIPTIAMLTDFGEQDGFVGILKAVIYKTLQKQYMGFSQTNVAMPQIVDLSHNIGRQDVFNAAWVLENAFLEFPDPCVFVCVVDPEVGNPNQKQLLMKSNDDNYYFIAPDNGLLTPIVHYYPDSLTIYSIENPKFFRESNNDESTRVSQTFHGRDIYAPLGAHVASALMQHRLPQFLEEIGPIYKNPILLPWLAPINKSPVFQGHVVHCDVFGNVITNIPGEWAAIGDDLTVKVCGHEINTQLVESYSQASKDYAGYEEISNIFVVVSSTGTLELFVPYGHARNLLKVSSGEEIEITRRS